MPRPSFQVPGLTGDVSEKFASASTTVPSAPLSSTPFALRAAPSRRSSWPTRSATPAPAQASRIRSAAATVVAIGFSTKTCLPRAAAASVCSSCASFGVASRTASAASSASSNEPADVQPKRSANAARRSASRE